MKRGIENQLWNWFCETGVASLSLLALVSLSIQGGVARAESGRPFSQTDAPGALTPLLGAERGIEASRVLRTETELTLVNASVTDPKGLMVVGLESHDFRVYENNQEQEIVNFTMEDVPVSIGVIFDISGSMANKIENSRLAAMRFFRIANPQDEFFLVTFNDRARLVSTFTTSIDDLENRLMHVSAYGLTALYDGIYLGLSQMKEAQNKKKALLIISDGGDNHSRYSEEDVRKFLKESDVQMYTMRLLEPGGDSTAEERQGSSVLYGLSEVTGGRSFEITNLNDLPDVAKKISLQLRNQYVIGYQPSDRVHDGKWRRIKIKVQAPAGLPPLSVEAKHGYYAPNN